MIGLRAILLCPFSASRKHVLTLVVFTARCYAKVRPMPSCGVRLSVRLSVRLPTPAQIPQICYDIKSLRCHRCRVSSQITNMLTLNGHIKTAQQQTIIQQYGDWYTGRWWVGCYIWYSEEGPGWAAAPPSPLLTVPNVTAHPLTASLPTSCYSMWRYNYLCPLKG